MTDKKDETGKGPPGPGGGPRRPYATLDLQATQVGGTERSGPAAGTGGKPDSRPTAALPPPGPQAKGGARASLSDGFATAGTWARKAVQSNTFLSHVAAGVAGAVLTLAAAALIGLFAGGDRGERRTADFSKRLAAVEQAIEKRAAALANDVGVKIGATDARVAKLEEGARALGDVADAQAKLAAEAKALEARIAAPELTERVAKLEAALAADDKSGRVAVSANLATKLAELEKLAGQASETAKS